MHKRARIDWIAWLLLGCMIGWQARSMWKELPPLPPQKTTFAEDRK